MASNGKTTSTTTTTSLVNVVDGVGKKIKAIVLTSTGSGSDYSNLQVKEEDYPHLERDDQVIVRLKASGLNFAELMQRQGLYRPSTKTPYTPGYEGSGVVELVGSGVTDLHVNDRVLVFNSSGIWKDVVSLPRSNVLKIPDEMSFEDAAGFLVNYMTAYQILFRMACIKPGDHILIHMAAGGVGTAATQLCRTVPGVVIIGTASSGKHDAIRENGVDYAIDYTATDYVAEVKRICPHGVDVVLDPLNGDNSIKGYNLLKPLGKIIHFGAASMTSESRSLVNAFKAWWKCLTVNSFDIMSDNKMVGGYHLGYLLNNPVMSTHLLNDINALLEMYKQGKIKIKIDSTYSFSKVGEAMKRLHSRQNIGKVLLKPDYEFHPPVSSEQIKIVTTVVTTTTSTPVVQTQVEQKSNSNEQTNENETGQESAKMAEDEEKSNLAWKTTNEPIKMDREERKVPITIESVKPLTDESQSEREDSEKKEQIDPMIG